MAFGESARLHDLLESFACAPCCAASEIEDRKAVAPRTPWDFEEEEEVEPFPTGARVSNVFDDLRTRVPPPPQEFGNSSGILDPGGFDDWGQHTAPMPRRSEGSADDGLEELPEVEVEGGYLYSGQWRGQVRHGQGVLERRSEGIRYEGAFVDGQAHGRGVFVGSDGSTYDGEWERDHMHGYGKYVDVDGSVYEGEWVQDQKSGRGIEWHSDGARYEGEFWMGGKHGAGIYRSGTGVEYEGQYAHDKMDGEGRYTFADGRSYSGQWAAGRMHGVGKMTWPNGSRYEGGFQQDKKHGDGTFTWPDGRAYCGQFNKGQLDGPGVLIDASGEEHPQEWVNGRQIIEEEVEVDDDEAGREEVEEVADVHNESATHNGGV
mmetsp:Transcript_84725/g.165791  ORF Transcript_84725/g.165791 Transcript_84725/m.165791 type:complete len:375 (-) Transcript_84725:88-1212(-)